jgi:hypothetical protein
MENNQRQQWIAERTSVLQASSEPAELELAGTDLARSDDPDALDALGAFLLRSMFLDRLDDPASEDPMLHFRWLVAPFIERPSREVERLCLSVVDQPFYLTPDRKSLILEALSRVPVMSQGTVEAFRRANQQGYFAFVALRLVRNGSPPALDLFRSMMADRKVDVQTRVELIHSGILPFRTRLSTLKMAGEMLKDELEEPAILAVIESVFDYRADWFTMHGPEPPGWRTASDDALQAALALGQNVMQRPGLSESLAEAIQNTTELAWALLNRRAA